VVQHRISQLNLIPSGVAQARARYLAIPICLRHLRDSPKCRIVGQLIDVHVNASQKCKLVLAQAFSFIRLLTRCSEVCLHAKLSGELDSAAYNYCSPGPSASLPNQLLKSVEKVSSAIVGVVHKSLAYDLSLSRT